MRWKSWPARERPTAPHWQSPTPCPAPLPSATSRVISRPARRRGQRERGAPEQIARGGTEHLPDGGPVHHHLVRPERDRRAGRPGPDAVRCATHTSRTSLAPGRAGDAGRRGQRAPERRPERVAGPLLAPAVAGRDAAVGRPVLVHVRERPQVRPDGRAERLDAVGGPPAAGRIVEGVDRRPCRRSAPARGSDRTASRSFGRLRAAPAVHLVGDRSRADRSPSAARRRRFRSA